MTNVNMGSEVFPGDFRGVGDPDSIHSQRMRREGAFHAINIDLCGGVAGKQGNDGLPNYFAAVKALLEHQHYWRQEFLFFLTTRIDEGSVAAHHRGRVPAIAQNAADSCEEYVEQFLHSWKIDADGEKLVVASSVGADEAFMLGLTQWIVDAGVEIGLKSRVRSIMTYRTGKGTEGPDDIASIAIRFKPEPDIASDVHGMVSPAPDAASSASRRCEQSALIPRRVADRTLVDLILRNDASALDKCVQQSSELLEAAGYDPDAYVRWVWEEKERYEAA